MRENDFPHCEKCSFFVFYIRKRFRGHSLLQRHDCAVIRKSTSTFESHSIWAFVIQTTWTKTTCLRNIYVIQCKTCRVFFSLFFFYTLCFRKITRKEKIRSMPFISFTKLCTFVKIIIFVMFFFIYILIVITIFSNTTFQKTTVVARAWDKF